VRDARASESVLEDADFACAFEDEGVHVRKTTRKLMTMPMPTIVLMKDLSSGRFDEFMSVMYSAMERTRLLGSSLRISARVGFGVAFAAHIEDGDALFGAGNILGGFEWDEKRAPLPCATMPQMVKA